MKLIFHREKIGNALDIVEKALPVRTTVQNIESILLNSDGSNITLTATNLEVDIRVQIQGCADSAGSILLPKKIVDIVRYLPAADVEIEVNYDTYKIDLSCGSAKYILYGADPVDYPNIDIAAPEGEIFFLQQNALRQVLKEVVFAASTDESRPAFNGVLFIFNDDSVILNSSDTYRLVVEKINQAERSFSEGRFLVPAKALKELLRIVKDDGEVSIYTHKKQVIFKFGDVYFASRVLEEKYPDVSGVIPSARKTCIRVQRKLLEDTISRASLLSEGINHVVQLLIEDNSLIVKVSSQIGRMEEELPVEKEGEDVEVYVNSRFVIDILKVIDTADILIEFHGKNGPLVFKIPEKDGYLYLVLPIKME